MEYSRIYIKKSYYNLRLVKYFILLDFSKPE